MLSLVATAYAKLTTRTDVTSTTFIDLPALLVALPCAAGDTLLIDAEFQSNNTNASGNTIVRIMLNDGSIDIDPQEGRLNAVGQQEGNASMHFRYVVPNHATYAIRGQAYVTLGSASFYGDPLNNSSIRVQQFRG